MTKDLYDQGFGSLWEHVHVRHRAGYSTSVVDYHRHDFYEVNLILSGNVKILLEGGSEQGKENRLVLTRPGTAHYISCKPDTLYSRLYLVFTEECVDRISEWEQLSSAFGKWGRILTLTPEQTESLRVMIEQIGGEQSLFRQRMLIYYLLSHVLELAGEEQQAPGKSPSYIIDALAYMEAHYSEKIVAAELARHLNVSRTTLMTEFKKHTDRTLLEYLTHCRIKHAVKLLREGRTLEDVADQCGFADSSGLIRSFRRCYGTTPHRYMEKLTD